MAMIRKCICRHFFRSVFANVRPVTVESATAHLSPLKNADEIDFVVVRESAFFNGDKCAVALSTVTGRTFANTPSPFLNANNPKGLGVFANVRPVTVESATAHLSPLKNADEIDFVVQFHGDDT
jgi:isocitrate/isopropylmalate dehydrogenase